MNIDEILDTFYDYHLEKSSNEQKKIISLASEPKYLNVTFKKDEYVPPKIKDHAEKAVAHSTVAHTVKDPIVKKEILDELKKLLGDENIKTEQDFMALIIFMYTALTGICKRQNGKLIGKCLDHTKNNRQWIEEIKKKLDDRGIKIK